MSAPSMAASTRRWPLLASAHHRPLPFTACADSCPVSAGERPRTRVNEPGNEPTGWAAAGRSSRFRGLRRAIRCRLRVYRVWAGRRFAFAGGQLWTGVNATRTEPGGWAADGEMAHCPGGARERRGDLVGVQPGPGPGRSRWPGVYRVQVRACRPGQPCRARRLGRVPVGGRVRPAGSRSGTRQAWAAPA